MAAGGAIDVEVRYVDADGEPVVTSLRELDARRVVRGRPVRKILSRVGQRHYPGLFWSATTGGHVPYESRLELDRLWLADFDPTVTWFAAQPLWLSGRDGQVLRRHVPDVLVQRRDGSLVLVDVKPRRLTARPEVAAVLDWTASLCAAKTWRYEVWSGEDPVLLANVRWLSAGRRQDLIQPQALDVVARVGRSGMTIDEVVEVVAQQLAAPRAMAAVLSLLWTGVWTIDMSRPVGGDTVLSCPGTTT